MSHVYVISTLINGMPCSPIKIGMTGHPQKRLAALRTSSPNPLALSMFFGPMSRGEAERVEKMAHDACAGFRRNGEWFDLTADIGIDVVESAVNLICVGAGRGDVEYAKLSTRLGIAAARMRKEPV